jgi:DNA-binding winged helix-turn-helix (wHTH) protein
MIITFGTTTVDVEARSVSRDRHPVHLTPKAFDMLVMLATARPRALPKAEILERVWPGTFVTDASLARTVHEIRDAIGDADGSIIRTVHGHGYAFAAEAIEEQPQRSPAVLGPPRGWLYLGIQPIPLHDGVWMIGRDPAATLSLPFPEASWHHVRLTVNAAGVTIEDLGSKNGTFVGGRRVTAPTELGDGDELHIGVSYLRFVRPAPDAGTATAPEPRGPKVV